jgi:hypothetical protein
VSTHPSHRFTETYIVERHYAGTKPHHVGEWLEVMRFSHSANAREYVRNNTPTFSPWRIVRLRTETRSEVLEAQSIERYTHPTTTEPEGGER